MLGFGAACGLNHKHIGRCTIQGILCITWSGKDGNAPSMFRLLEPWRRVLEWTSSTSFRPKPATIELGSPLFCRGCLRHWALATSIPLPKTHVDWSQIGFGVYLSPFVEIFSCIWCDPLLSCTDFSTFCFFVGCFRNHIPHNQLWRSEANVLSCDSGIILQNSSY